MNDSETAFIERHVEPGSDAHYAVLFTPSAQRRQVAAVFGIHRTLRELLAIQPDVAPAKISWWHEEIDRLRSARAVHPLCQVLNDLGSDALCEALNALLHGAVMDFNQIDVDDSALDDYLLRRDGAIHDALAALAGTAIEPERRASLAHLQSIPAILADARHPAHARQPNVTLTLGQADSNDAIETTLRSKFDQAALQWAANAAPSPASAVSVALAIRSLPRILDTPYGDSVARHSPWRTLWTAWRAARQSTNKGNPP